jgi:hypothetical protein
MTKNLPHRPTLRSLSLTSGLSPTPNSGQTATLRPCLTAGRQIAFGNFFYPHSVRRNGGSHDDFVDVIVEDNVDGSDGIDIKIKRNKCGYLLNSANSRFVRRKRIND